MMMDERLCKTKLAARLHDPVEKALVLMRTAMGHEGGSSHALQERLGLTGLAPDLQRAVQRADHWASAADRAAFPNRSGDRGFPAWQRVHFHQRPVIIHPLTGEQFELDKLLDVDPGEAEALSIAHFEGLIHEANLAATALAFWRFGPAVAAKEVTSLWAQLPADTRVPDHTIHDHLDLTAALASAFALDEDGAPALLAVSLGPVQEFIAASRSTSDLWASSHFLSRLAWEAMRVICEALGPEAVLFPRLRGVPQVDLWLESEMGVDGALFDRCDWRRRRSDANPLFAAALPNRFTALVPAKQARTLAERIVERTRSWVSSMGHKAFQLLLEAAGVADKPSLYGYRQLEEQLQGFPEVHWATVPWTLVGCDPQGKVDASDSRLAEAMQPFFESSPPGYLGSRAWGLLSGGVELEHGWFWKPNPGTLYPALHELLERTLAAAKGARCFLQTTQHGWRESLSGDSEWLTDEQALLNQPAGKRKSRRDDVFDEQVHKETLWTRVADERPSWAKRGEHLGALNTLKRLWPSIFVGELGDLVGADFNRFVVSTHTMAMASSLDNAVRSERPVPDELREELERGSVAHVALPPRLNETLSRHTNAAILRQIPGWLEAARESEDESEQRAADRLLESYLGHKPEAYYAMLLMDGDRMGAWLSASPEQPGGTPDEHVAREYRESFHPQIRNALESMGDDEKLVAYVREKRSPSPSRHMAVSEALNHFALRLAAAVIEQQHNGRIIYAGGDDLMAMLPVMDLLPAMAGLRAAYSGLPPAQVGAESLDIGLQRQASGFALYKGELLRLMGDKATASCGAVVAHHQAPLGAVLRELRASEQQAKGPGGRNAFSLAFVKRSGGALRLTAKWGEPLRRLAELRAFLSEPDVSRRAVYNSTLWLRDLPEPDHDGEMVARMLAYQLARQAGKKSAGSYDLPVLARALVRQAMAHAPRGALAWLENFLSVAEFLARESRIPSEEMRRAAEEERA